MLKTIVINPKKRHTHTMLLLHGYSCTARSMTYYTRHINKYIPNNIGMKFILPQAPKRYISCYDENESAWYDYYTDHCDKEEEIEHKHVDQMDKSLQKIIKKEVKENLNNDYSKIFVGGNSQGACQGLSAALSMSEKLGGIISFRGHVISNRKPLHKQDIWASHGEKDDTISYNVAKDSYQNLVDEDFDLFFHSEKNLDHCEHSNKEFESCGKWLNKKIN